MATERTAMMPDGSVIFLDENKDAMLPSGSIVSIEDLGGAVPAFKAAWANQATTVQGLQGIS